MRWVLCLTMLMQAASAAEPVRGVLVDREGDARAGQLSVRGADFHVRIVLYDEATEIRREDATTPGSGLRAGDLLEADCTAESGLKCQARRIVVLRAAAPARPSWSRATWVRSDGGASWAPRGQLLLAGVIAEVSGDRIRLRSRGGARYLLRVREDTSLLGDGLTAGREQLRVNQHVFVRAGRGSEDELEAYEVV
ncbi:MAG: DUF5666 domain-containing protein, partial [Bryobacterales bacterium]|nr:DUF5666 domain-containing protein [Bryobacteraceae bacterium]MDW8131769.1 DUF5666 domain-containing protein [Bryobacterales bacterium]